MRIDILTLFPDACDFFMSQSIIGRAQKNGLVKIVCHNIRDYTKNKQKQVDDYPYGGGMGMVMQAEPLYDCWLSVCNNAEVKPHTILMSPLGVPFRQQRAKEIANEYSHIILVCGHYEGIDQRFIDLCVDEEISIGDYVLTGGELAAMVVSDAVCRLVPGVLSDTVCFTDESHYSSLLEYPQYSRPCVWNDIEVPEVLLSGHHKNIEKWRREQSLLITAKRRPDMLKNAELTKEDKDFLKQNEID